MEIWNSRNLDNNQRFIAAVIVGIFAAIGIGILYGLICQWLAIISGILYVAIGYAVGYVVRNVGHGVHKRFAVLGACLTILAIIIGDCVAMYGLGQAGKMLITPSMWLPAIQIWLQVQLSTNLYSILGIILRLLGIYVGYNQSVIL